MSHYDNNLDKNNANFIPLTPLSFLERAKDIYPDYEENKKFYDDKINTAKFYFEKVLPRAEQHYKSAISGSSNIMNFNFN